ncbi:MAG TPA: MotA/TolQ/ExbB proton channel family protein [Alphaproteobacteria bacterium]|jgi:TolQ protein
MDGTVVDIIPQDHSMLGLFLQADIIVKLVILLLVVASVICWTVILDKALRYTRARRAANAFAKSLQGDGVILGGSDGDGIIADILAAGTRAWRDEDATESRAERRTRIERAMRAAMIDELKRLEGGLSWLATVGSTAPFIGLFGTVWGIMNSFTAIAASKDTSLAVVAPGIAEALFATAIGLVAAIPAVMAYNKLSGSLSGIAHRLNMCIGELGDRMARGRAGSHAAGHVPHAAHTAAGLREAH